jgi:hypothetical protein
VGAGRMSTLRVRVMFLVGLLLLVAVAMLKG